MSALNGSSPGVSIDNTREPESSDGTNRARQTAQECSRSDCKWTSDTMRVLIASIGLSSAALVFIIVGRCDAPVRLT
jgi:hypothetical protein